MQGNNRKAQQPDRRHCKMCGIRFFLMSQLWRAVKTAKRLNSANPDLAWIADSLFAAHCLNSMRAENPVWAVAGGEGGGHHGRNRQFVAVVCSQARQIAGLFDGEVVAVYAFLLDFE